MKKHAAPNRVLQWALAALVTIGADAGACTLAIEDVAVVTMTSGRITPNRTVLLDGRTIAAVTSRLPAGACLDVIDGRGKFLAPGLIDAHVHVESETFAAAFGQKPTPIDFEAVLALYPAFGVTAVRVMSGASDILSFRDRSPTARPVPRLVVASPMIAGHPPILPEPVTLVVETPEAASAAVDGSAAQGYDLIKVRENLHPEILRAIIAAARAKKLEVDGHLTRGVTVDAVLDAGQRGFAHLDEITRAIEAGGASAASLKRNDAYVSSAMVVLKSAIGQISDYDRLVRRPEMRFVHPLFVNSFWSHAQNPYLKPGVDRTVFETLLRRTKRTLLELTHEGVTILAGSDALNPMIIPGEGLHDELQLMVDAGLTPYDALRTATVNPAKVIKRLANAGVVAPGHDADLVLLSSNPLANIAAYRRPDGVVLQGRWFDREALDRRLEDVAAAFRPTR